MACATSRFRAGSGAEAFSGPSARGSSSASRMSPTSSARWIHGCQKSPLPSGPPAKSRNGRTSCGNAPPPVASTMPVRITTTRARGRAAHAASSHSRRDVREEARPRPGRLVEHLVAARAVVPDRTARHEHARPARGEEPGHERGRAEPAVADAPLLPGGPAPVRDRIARQVDAGVRGRERLEPRALDGRIALHDLHALREAGGVRPAREGRDRVAAADERGPERAADEPRRAGDEDVHRSAPGPSPFGNLSSASLART